MIFCEGWKTSVVASSPMLNTKVLKTWRNRQKVIDLRTTGGRYFGYKTRPSPPCRGLLTLYPLWSRNSFLIWFSHIYYYYFTIFYNIEVLLRILFSKTLLNLDQKIKKSNEISESTRNFALWFDSNLARIIFIILIVSHVTKPSAKKG